MIRNRYSKALSASWIMAVNRAGLVIEGITCAACVWLLEHHLSALKGVTQASVNLTNHRAQISWQPEEIELSQILLAIYNIGYQGHPYHPNKEEQLLAAETRGQPAVWV